MARPPRVVAGARPRAAGACLDPAGESPGPGRTRRAGRSGRPAHSGAGAHDRAGVRSAIRRSTHPRGPAASLPRAGAPLGLDLRPGARRYRPIAGWSRHDPMRERRPAQPHLPHPMDRPLATGPATFRNPLRRGRKLVGRPRRSCGMGRLPGRVRSGRCARRPGSGPLRKPRPPRTHLRHAMAGPHSARSRTVRYLLHRRTQLALPPGRGHGVGRVPGGIRRGTCGRRARGHGVFGDLRQPQSALYHLLLGTPSWSATRDRTAFARIVHPRGKLGNGRSQHDLGQPRLPGAVRQLISSFSPTRDNSPSREHS